jgi:hypothetical protein
MLELFYPGPMLGLRAALHIMRIPRNNLNDPARLSASRCRATNICGHNTKEQDFPVKGGRDPAGFV